MLDAISQNLHDAALDRAAKYLIAEAELLSAILEIDRHKVYEKFGEPYLTPYCTKYLNLSEDVAAMFVRVTRKSRQVPELELAVREGLQISKARVIASVINGENKQRWIEKAQTLSKEKLEREVAAANPSAVKPEKVRPTGPDRVRIEFEVSYEEAELLKRARELMSQKRRMQAQIGETVVVALKSWVEREDPVLKAERAHGRKGRKPQSPPRGGSVVPARVLHQVHLRDRGSCRMLMLDGSTCGRKQWTEIHHVVPRAHGGADTLENLITLCGAHHRQMHRSSA